MAIQADKSSSEEAGPELNQTPLLEQERWEPTVDLLIDGTVLPKRGKELPKVGLHYDTRTDSLHRDQKLVISSLKVGELLLPWDFKTYVNK